MKIIKFPKRNEWPELLTRPEFERNQFTKVVSDILSEVKLKGDSALFDFTKKFDKATLGSLLVCESEINEAIKLVPEDLKNAINLAKYNIEKFHSSQNIAEPIIETTKGVKCWRKNVAIEKVGLYIPGGTAPLFSTILMLAIPAKIAGCKEVVLCTPPDANGSVNAAILYTASLVGVANIFKVGGAQAIAAMAWNGNDSSSI